MTMLQSLTLGPSMAEAVDEAAQSMTEADLRESLAVESLNVELLRENLADLELALEDRGWTRADTFGRNELSRSALGQASTLARTMALANPLIRRGLNLRIAYVWGQGLTISAKATGPSTDAPQRQDVNDVVQTFLDDPDVRKVLTSAAARERNERALGTDGNLFVALFTAPRTGTVQPRVVTFSEVVDVVKNPDDRTDVWFYRRDVPGKDGQKTTTYHPDINYRPRAKVRRLTSDHPDLGANGSGAITDPGDVEWDAPITHLKVNDFPEWDFGVGDAFAATSWARAYKEGLEDWAKLVKALSRFAWRLTGGTRSATQAAAARMRQRPTTDATSPRVETAVGENPRPVGQAWTGVGGQLEAIPKTGATVDSQSFRPLAAMVASGLDLPVTMLLGDPGVTGSRATAETLDTPTELMATGRRDVWSDFLRRLLDYVIDQSAKAPQGALKGRALRDEWGREVVVLDGDTDRSLVFDWPDLTDTPVNVLMAAIEAADGLHKLPPLLIVRLAMTALGVRDVDEWLAEVTDDQGEFLPPPEPVGDATTRRFRQGQDPAANLS